MKLRRFVVIGGGISGLAAAHRLAELRRANPDLWTITLLEASERLGGVIHTQRADGVLLEGGPDAFLTEKPWAVELCRRLGLGPELLETNPRCRRSFILRRGKPVAIPEGWHLLAPASLATLLLAPLLSWRGRIRMAGEAFVPRRRDEEDQSVGSFIRRRFGQEALARIGQPMLSAIYAADPDALSLRSTMPRFHALEQRHGSILRGLRAETGEQSAATQQASGPRYSLFATLRGGLSTLVDAIARDMPEVSVRCGSPVARLIPGETWTVILQNGQLLEADAVCLALPAPQAASLIAPVSPDLAQALSAITYESVATANLIFRREGLPRLPDGFGLIVPAIERRRLIGVTFASQKFPGRAPEDAVLIRAFLGGSSDREAAALNDAALTTLVQEELRALLGIRTPPARVTIHRHPQAMPQYRVGHLGRVARIESLAARQPGFWLIGNAYHGIGIPDCIHQAELSAERMAAWAQQAAPGATSA